MSTFTLLASESELQNLTPTGTALMIGCVGFVLALCVFCFWRLTRSRETVERHHAPLDIDTHDTDDSVRCPDPGCRALNDPQAEYCHRCGERLPGSSENA